MKRRRDDETGEHVRTTQLSWILACEAFKEKSGHVRDVAPSADAAVVLRVPHGKVFGEEAVFLLEASGEDGDASASCGEG